MNKRRTEIHFHLKKAKILKGIIKCGAPKVKPPGRYLVRPCCCTDTDVKIRLSK
jgi:hypothetical protein